MSLGHVLVQGETKSGKTTWANELHRRFAGVSVFFNTNLVPDVWGARVHHVGELAGVLAQGHKVNFLPAEDEATRDHQLRQIKNALFRWGQGSHGRVWAQLVADEAHVLEDAVLVTLATRGLNAYGVRLVAISQYPAPIPMAARTNLWVRVVFAPGIEGLQFLRQKGYPADEIESWTNHPYHFVFFDHGRTMRKRRPIPLRVPA